MIRVAICDDAPEMTGEIERTLAAYNPTLFDVSVFFTAGKLISSLQSNQYDFFILDIELPSSSGIDIAKEIRKHNLTVPIVFLTNFSEYMEDVFQVQTFDYILKPITKEKLFPVIKKIIKYLDLDDTYFSFTYKRIEYNLKFAEIVYFEKQKRIVITHTVQQTFQAIMSTPELLQKLNANFVQVHTSYIVNINYIKEVGADHIILTTDFESMKIPISRKFKTTARDAIIMKMRSKL
ncbi:two-component system response regulator [Secundilactobacillus pentosiphilus]|uniref:Two-component system response regulator n=1 Tax=Secundilactobacillus pentosiphilus TaxID=1714682 RepID=A0A1Z5IZ30_9LACO|nr:LytTR family DNA-binding domain-containing protein [Secundilactobacillus pentosiphilus]GAX07100.1 two-component system response regulator [Secundilactobacillus pentosiphilus]